MDNDALGKRIRRAREARGCTVKEFAELVELTTNYVHQVERGERTLSLASLRRCARLLSVTTDWLLGLTRTGGPKR